MSDPGQGTIDEQVQQRIADIERWRAWARQVQASAPGSIGVGPGDVDSTVTPMVNIITGKAPPTPPQGYNAAAPEQLLAYLDSQVAFCQQQAARLRALVGPDAFETLPGLGAGLVMGSSGDRD